jgi:hypothetical protein
MCVASALRYLGVTEQRPMISGTRTLAYVAITLAGGFLFLIALMVACFVFLVDF